MIASFAGPSTGPAAAYTGRGGPASANLLRPPEEAQDEGAQAQRLAYRL
jgi:hypothetical protein